MRNGWEGEEGWTPSGGRERWKDGEGLGEVKKAGLREAAAGSRRDRERCRRERAAAAWGCAERAGTGAATPAETKSISKPFESLYFGGSKKKTSSSPYAVARRPGPAAALPREQGSEPARTGAQMARGMFVLLRGQGNGSQLEEEKGNRAGGGFPLLIRNFPRLRGPEGLRRPSRGCPEGPFGSVRLFPGLAWDSRKSRSPGSGMEVTEGPQRELGGDRSVMAQPVSAFQAAYISIEVLIALVSVPGNILVIWAVKMNQALRDATFCFIVSLAVADVAVGALVIPLAIIIDIGPQTEFYSCLMVACPVLILTESSILALLAIAVDRYLRVKIPVSALSPSLHACQWPQAWGQLGLESPDGGGGEEYPIDIWLLLASYIRPEDIVRFSLICKKAWTVTCTAAFWTRLYRRLFLEVCVCRVVILARFCEESIWGLIVDVAGGSVVSRIADEFRMWLVRMCLLFWCKKIEGNRQEAMWEFNFKFKKQSPRFKSKCCKGLQPPIQYEEVHTNPDQDCCLLQITTFNFIFVPIVMGMTFTLFSLGVSSDMRHHRVRLQFQDAPERSGRKPRPDQGLQVVLDPVHSVKLLDWWHPQYPFSPKA
ncbi:transmembrane protein 183A [Indicator indicator]|uniref:transmembrane protein 183A n=1 Tax=Indicator indicator TaxID=1002788 RepID=UPI0023DFBC41|nr:transmembrane protein 183A [Indicator indicator]